MCTLFSLCILGTLRADASSSSTDSRGTLIYTWHNTLTLAPGLVSCHKQYWHGNPGLLAREEVPSLLPFSTIFLTGKLVYLSGTSQPMAYLRISFCLKESTRTSL